MEQTVRVSSVGTQGRDGRPEWDRRRCRSTLTPPGVRALFFWVGLAFPICSNWHTCHTLQLGIARVGCFLLLTEMVGAIAVERRLLFPPATPSNLGITWGWGSVRWRGREMSPRAALRGARALRSGIGGVAGPTAYPLVSARIFLLGGFRVPEL